CVPSACRISVIIPNFTLSYASKTAAKMGILTKIRTAHLTHNGRAVLPFSMGKSVTLYSISQSMQLFLSGFALPLKEQLQWFIRCKLATTNLHIYNTTYT
ncbi:MAG: hypothetical protein IJ696_03185, partial [Ruminococcus sp.]|nr:hypothetical protein [Ruminococcus sp.]